MSFDSVDEKHETRDVPSFACSYADDEETVRTGRECATDMQLRRVCPEHMRPFQKPSSRPKDRFNNH